MLKKLLVLAMFVVAVVAGCSTPLPVSEQQQLVNGLVALQMLAPLLTQGHPHFEARLPLYEAVLVQLAQGAITDAAARAQLFKIFSGPAPPAPTK
jgi:hypothetical protein